MTEKPALAKAKRTAKGNIKLTLSPRQARLVLALLGPTYGGLGYTVYSPLHKLEEKPDNFYEELLAQRLNTDEVV